MEETREAALPKIHEGPVEGFTPDTPDSYPQAKTYPAFLPSGARFLLRRPNVLALLQRGDIPNPLIGVVQKAFLEGDLGDKARELAARADEAGRTPEAQLEWEIEHGLVSEEEQADTAALVQDVMEDDDIGAAEAISYIDVIVFGSVVKPPLTFAPPTSDENPVAADGRLSLAAVDDTDKMFIFQWATAQLDGIARFRGDGTGADSERDGGAVRAAPEHAVGATADA